MDPRREFTSLRRDPRFRRSFSAGIIGYGPRWVIAVMAVAGGIPYVALLLMTSRVVLCVNNTLARLPCDAPTSPNVMKWMGPWIAGSLLTAGFFSFDRICVQRRWDLRVGENQRLSIAHVYAVIAVPIASFVLSKSVNVAAFHTTLVTIVVSNVFLWIWQTLRRVGEKVVVAYSRARCLEWMLRDYIAQRFRSEPSSISLDHINRQIHVDGPYDEVDVLNLRQLADLDLRPWVEEVHVRSTLDASKYVIHPRSTVSYARHEAPDKPIRPAPEVSIFTFVSILVVLLAVLGTLFLIGGVLSWDDFSRLVEDALQQMGHLPMPDAAD